MQVRRLWKTALAGLLAVPLALPVVTSPATQVPTAIDATPVANVLGSTPLPAVASTSWQTNGTVHSLAYAGGRVYLAGQFTRVRPPGVAAGGVGEVIAKNIAAFDAATGVFVPAFKHTPNNLVWNLAVSPDQRTLYAGGDFTTMDGQPRTKVAAFDISTAKGPLTPFAPVITGARVRAVSASATAVYIGGNYTAANGQPRTNLAAYTTAGALLPWAPAVDDRISALLATSAGDKVVLGGDFDRVNGEFRRALGLVDAVTGTNETLDAGIIPGDCTNGCPQYSTVRSLVTDGSDVYVGAEGTGYGWFDGTLKFNPDSGKVAWKDNCLGATQAVTVIGTTLYVGSHAHDCADVPGGFPQAPLQQGWHHLISEDAATGTVQPWFPNTNAGPGLDLNNELGPRALATDGRQLFVAGSFTTVNGANQQGFTRFVPDSSKGAVPVAPSAPLATSNAAGKILVKFPGSYDLDDGQLTYRLYRDNVVIKTWTAATARWWFVPQFVHTDTVTGTHSYTVDATDAAGQTSPRSAAGSATTITNATNGGYPAAVKAQAPLLYWNFEQPIGSTTVTDASGRNRTGTVQRGVAFGAPGVNPGTRAITVDDAVISLNGAGTPVPSAYAMEGWFRTTSTTGGRIMGFGDSQSGTSASYGPFVYMDAGGQLIFGKWEPTTYNGVWGAKAYNDGGWHHVVASTNGSRLEMYVDGVRQGGGRPTGPTTSTTPSWFRVGTDSFTNWPLPPGTAGFTGSLDDVALYPTALTAGQVLTHFRRAG